MFKTLAMSRYFNYGPLSEIDEERSEASTTESTTAESEAEAEAIFVNHLFARDLDSNDFIETLRATEALVAQVGKRLMAGYFI